MKPFWLIEDFERDNSFDLLAKAVEAAGMEYRVEKYVPFGEERDFLNKIGDNSPRCLVFQGSIQFAKQLQKWRCNWVPGVWCSWNNYRCVSYYTHYGQFLLNKEYLMLPLGEVDRRKDEFFERWNGKFFMRPDSGAKSFTGKIITHDSVYSPHCSWSEWKFIMKEAEPTDLVVVSKPQMIHKEWRVVCSGNKAVTGSRYMTHGQTDYKEEFPQEVASYAEVILRSTKWRPDPIFVLDVCETKGEELHLLEIGAFSVAGLYLCDHNKLVEVASELAIEAYKEEMGHA